MSIQAVRKHLVTVTYLDYGSFLGTHYTTASSVDDSGPLSDGNYFESKADAESYLREWLNGEAAELARTAHGWTVSRGEDVSRRVDMNPHGLI